MRILSFSTWKQGAIGLFGLGAAGLWAASCGVATDDLFNSGETPSAANGSSGGTGGAASTGASGESSARGSGSGESSGSSGSGSSGSSSSASASSGSGGNIDACGGCPAGLACNPNLGCVECVNKTGCTDDGAKVCVNGLCAACATNADCPDTQSCQPATHTCALKCVGNGSACTGPTPFCDTTKNVCVECKDNNQCSGPQHLCKQGVCVDCATNANCAAPTPVCDTVRGQCVECVLKAQCSDGQVCSGGVCAPRCDDKSPCDSGRCDLPTGKCIECLSGADCPDGGKPLCSPLQRCVECVSTSDCGMGKACIQFACVSG